MAGKMNFADSRGLRSTIHVLGLLYLVALVALLIANHFLRSTSPFVALASTFNLYLFVAAVPLALGLLLLRTRTALAIVILLAGLFLLTQPVLPQAPAVWPAKGERPTVSAMTFNLGLSLTAPELLVQTIAAE